MEIQNFVQRMNNASKIEVNTECLVNRIKKDENLQRELERQIKGILVMKDEYSDEEVIKKLNLPNLNKATLREMAESTGEKIYERLINLKDVKLRLQTLNNIKKNMNDGFVRPQYGVNEKNMITVKEPALGRLDNLDMFQLFGFSKEIKFERFEDLYKFLMKINKVIVKKEERSAFIVVGLTLYTTIKPVYITDLRNMFCEAWEVENKDRLVNGKWLESIKQVRAECSSVTTENIHIFQKIYEEIEVAINQTKQLEEEGVIEKHWYSFPSPDDACTEEVRAEMIEEHLYWERIYKENYDTLVSQYLELKAKMETSEIVTKDILKLMMDERIEQKLEETNKYVEQRFKFNFDKCEDDLRNRGFSEGHINAQKEKFKEINMKINKFYNLPDFKIAGEEFDENVFGFMFSGRNRVAGAKVIALENDEDGGMVYSVKVGKGKTAKVIAKKGSLHKTLDIIFDSGEVETVTEKNKKDSIRNAVLLIVNKLLQ
jgi:hypothetical protein